MSSRIPIDHMAAPTFTLRQPAHGCNKKETPADAGELLAVVLNQNAKVYPVRITGKAKKGRLTLEAHERKGGWRQPALFPAIKSYKSFISNGLELAPKKPPPIKARACYFGMVSPQPAYQHAKAKLAHCGDACKP